MLLPKRYTIFLALLLLSFGIKAQDLTGTWEGDLGNDQFIQLNILQTGNKICGYTFDHVKADERSFCKAFFEGSFNKFGNILMIDGKYFLKNSGSHILMQLSLNYRKKKGVEILEQLPREMIEYRERVSPFGIIMEPNVIYDSSEYVRLKKVSDKPYEIEELMKDCIARDKKQNDTILRKNVPFKKDNIPYVLKITTPEKPKEDLPPPKKKADSINTPKTITQRKNKEQKRIVVDVKNINLKVYDNAIMDGDTVSILYNGKMLLTHQLLSEKGIELNIELDENQTRNEITLFAENLGSIPPNTALIVVTAGTKRYELFASASLEENAVLVFEYKPK